MLKKPLIGFAIGHRVRVHWDPSRHAEGWGIPDGLRFEGRIVDHTGSYEFPYKVELDQPLRSGSGCWLWWLTCHPDELEFVSSVHSHARGG